MGFTPAQTMQMTVWEYLSCLAAFDTEGSGPATTRDWTIEDLRELGIMGA